MNFTPAELEIGLLRMPLVGRHVPLSTSVKLKILLSSEKSHLLILSLRYFASLSNCDKPIFVLKQIALSDDRQYFKCHKENSSWQHKGTLGDHGMAPHPDVDGG